MDRITRKELKTDHFVEDVGLSVAWLGEHRKLVIRIAIAAVVVIAAGLAFYYYQKRNRAERQEVLYSLREADNIAVSETGQGQPGTRVFRSEAEKRDYLTKGYTDLAVKYAGSLEACVAEIALGAKSAEVGKLPEAQGHFEKAADCSDSDVASLGKLPLAQLYFSAGKRSEGEKLLRDLIAKPTRLVSKEQATITLGEMLAPTNPAEARKLLEPLRGASQAVSRAAMMALAEIK